MAFLEVTTGREVGDSSISLVHNLQYQFLPTSGPFPTFGHEVRLALLFFSLLLSRFQYSYEGMEINSLPVELTVVWNGNFNIDNPAQNKGKKNYFNLSLEAVTLATGLIAPYA